jgi:hypothetical protein
MLLNIQTLMGRIYKVQANIGDSIFYVKEQLEEQEGTCVDDIQLVWKGSVLENDMKIKDIGIEHENKIQMVPKMRKCSCCR